MPTVLPVQLPGLSGLVGGQPFPPSVSGTAVTPGRVATGGAATGPGQLVDVASGAGPTGADGFQSVHTPFGATGGGQVTAGPVGAATLRVPGAAVVTPETVAPMGASTSPLGFAQVSPGIPFALPLFF